MVQALTVFSFGGGVQSTAALVLAAQGDLQVDAFLFCNVGDDSESDETLTYVDQYAKPYAEAHGLRLITLQRRNRSGEPETLRQRIVSGKRGIVIPARVKGRPLRRECTVDFKIQPVASWLWQHGARPQRPATIMLGITTEEVHRANNRTTKSYTRSAYPLLDRRMSRQDCMNLIAAVGLPIPPKSACYFCPFHTIPVWRELRERRPDRFQDACELEAHISQHPKMRQPAYLTRAGVPLALAVRGEQPSLFEDDTCESGYCMV